MTHDLSDPLTRAEREMARRMWQHMGSAEEQYQRLEALIDALDPSHATGIDRTSAGWWRGSKK